MADAPPIGSVVDDPFADEPVGSVAADPFKGETPGDAGIGDAIYRGLGRGAWALPGLVGLTHAKAQGLWDAASAAASGELPMSSLGEFASSFRDRAGRKEEAIRGAEQSAAQNHPIATGLSVGAGALPSALLAAQAIPSATAGLAAPSVEASAPAALATRVTGSALDAAGQGALLGLGTSNATTPGGRVADSAIGAASGAALGGLAPGASPMAPVQTAAREAAKDAGSVERLTATVEPTGVRRFVEQRIDPIPEALALREQGVPLTAGQMNPRSSLAQIEEASTSLRATGPIIQSKRDAAVRAWQDLALRQAVPPGAKAPATGELADDLAGIYDAFGPAYEAVKGQPVYPAIHMNGKGIPLQSTAKAPGAFDLAVRDPAVLADDATRATVKGFLDNQLSLLPGKTQRPGMVTEVPIENMLTMRSNIRSAARDAVRQQNYPMSRLLGNAEDAVTQSIESQVAPEIGQTLRAVDAKYRIYKILEDAMARAGDSPSGFTPHKLTQAVRAASDKGEFARGGGGELRDLSRAGSRVFESTQPKTGARLLTVGPLGEYVTGPLVVSLNRSGAPALPPGPGASLTPGRALAINDPTSAALIEFLRSKGLAVRAPVGSADEE